MQNTFSVQLLLKLDKQRKSLRKQYTKLRENQLDGIPVSRDEVAALVQQANVLTSKSKRLSLLFYWRFQKAIQVDQPLISSYSDYWQQSVQAYISAVSLQRCLQNLLRLNSLPTN